MLHLALFGLKIRMVYASRSFLITVDNSSYPPGAEIQTYPAKKIIYIYQHTSKAVYFPDTNSYKNSPHLKRIIIIKKANRTASVALVYVVCNNRQMP